MNEEQKEARKGNRLRWFRLWLVLAGGMFVLLLVVTQFLPGGTRSFRDWMWPLGFLLAVTLITATATLGVWLAVRPPYCWKKHGWLLFFFAGVAVLLAVFKLKDVWRQSYPSVRIPGLETDPPDRSELSGNASPAA